MKVKSILFICGIILALNVSAHSNLLKPRAKKASALNVKLSLNEMTKNLEFDFCRAFIRVSLNHQLDELAKYVIEKNAIIALRGHADAIGTYVGNWKMSDNRAVSVKDYLVKRGVATDKIITTPFGSTLPIASNKTAIGRQHNRRVEITLQDAKSI
jgi:outer membrane protein OmpA-like peptidoglycan-associated protein